MLKSGDIIAKLVVAIIINQTICQTCGAVWNVESGGSQQITWLKNFPGSRRGLRDWCGGGAGAPGWIHSGGEEIAKNRLTHFYGSCWKSLFDSNQVDGLDPSKAYLEGAMDRGIFRCFACIPLAKKHRFSYQESLLQLRRPGDTDPHSWQQLWRASMLCGILSGGQETLYLKILRWNIFWQFLIYAVDSSNQGVWGLRLSFGHFSFWKCDILMQGLISPLSFPELIRITKPGGFILWNIATGYEHYGRDYAKYEDDLLNLCRRSSHEWWNVLCIHQPYFYTEH